MDLAEQTRQLQESLNRLTKQTAEVDPLSSNKIKIKNDSLVQTKQDRSDLQENQNDPEQ